MNLRRFMVLAALSSLLIAGVCAAKEPKKAAGAEEAPPPPPPPTQATDEERPPPDEPAVKPGETPSQEEGETTSTVAEAPAPAEKIRRVSLGLLLGWGIDFVDGNGNSLGIGIGARGGYSLDIGLYLGGQIAYFFGGSYTSASYGGDTEHSNHTIMLGIEGGWDFKLDPMTVRPSLGLGLALPGESRSGVESGSETKVYAYLAPGVSVLWPIKNFFLGGDLRFVEITAPDSVEGITILVNGGITL